MASAPAASSNSPAVTFSSTPLAGSPTGNLASGLVSSNLIVSAGVPLRLRAQVCSRANWRNRVDAVVFDGEPSGGRVVAWKRIHVPDSGQCESTWFNWARTRGKPQFGGSDRTHRGTVDYSQQGTLDYRTIARACESPDLRALRKRGAWMNAGAPYSCVCGVKREK
jgi:hypothetical protein